MKSEKMGILKVSAIELAPLINMNLSEECGTLQGITNHGQSQTIFCPECQQFSVEIAYKKALLGQVDKGQVNFFLIPFDRCGYKYSYERNDDGSLSVEAFLLNTKATKETDQIKKVGRLKWDSISGEIAWISVNDNHQRKGIASEMYHIAVALSKLPTGIILPRHSSVKTEEGDAWVNSLRE